jgi:anhydro-N-acetylmuramic acid kinase
MTGTSCDGLDAACVEIGPKGWKPLWSASVSYPKALREKALRFQQPDTRLPIRDWLAFDSELGNWYGEVLRKMIRAPKVPARHRPDVIANHGQTLAHFPMLGKQSATLQSGDPTRIAAATGLTVVSHFRQGDMAAGGQGAPLVPLFHRMMAEKLGGKSTGISIHNIGGISNLTYIGPKTTLAFDTGPGNIWIDNAAEIATQGRLKMDVNGRLAAQGSADLSALASILCHPYFAKKAPKSTGRDDFPFSLLLSLTACRDSSLVATATAVTVESIALSYEESILNRRLPLSKVYLCGGGARNPVLVDWLAQRLPQIEITTLTSAGFDPQLTEAQAFAYFGYLSLLGKPLGGDWTGAKGFAPAGHIIPGLNWKKVAAFIESNSSGTPSASGTPRTARSSRN